MQEIGPAITFPYRTRWSRTWILEKSSVRRRVFWLGDSYWIWLQKESTVEEKLTAQLGLLGAGIVVVVHNEGLV